MTRRQGPEPAPPKPRPLPPDIEEYKRRRAEREARKLELERKAGWDMTEKGNGHYHQRGKAADNRVVWRGESKGGKR